MERKRRKTRTRMEHPLKGLGQSSLKKDRLEEFANSGTKLLNHPLTKVVIYGTALYGILYVSKYFIRASANMVDACKELKSAYQQ